MGHRVAAIQMCSTDSVAAFSTKKYIQQAVYEGAKFIILPENFAIMGLLPEDKK